MADFWTDLDRMLDAHERSEAQAEYARAFAEEFGPYADEPENREVLSYWDVKDPEVPVVMGYGGDHRVLIPGVWGE
jgi:hypothetical protein